MEEIADNGLGPMARLTLSSLCQACNSPSCWEEPVVYKALLISGLVLLTFSAQLLNDDLTLD